MQSLTSRATLDPETLYRALRQLVERTLGSLEGDTALDDCLDLVIEILGADRGVILVTATDGSSRAVNARRQGASLTAVEREEISKTIVRDAFDSDKPVIWHRTVDQTGSVTALGIVAALAVRLDATARDADGRRTVLYVDFRDVRKFVQPAHVEFFLAAALLVGALLESHARGETAREHLREALVHTTEARRTPPLEELLGTARTRPLLEEVRSALAGRGPILILGESGTGKTLLAHAIAEASGRRPIVRAMLGASDDLNTITSELFGHARGSFSGATSKRVGLVEFAHQGTIIFDELLNLPPHAQRLLLDFAQFGAYRPLGYDRAEPKRAEVRIIAATNGDLRAATRDGRFRDDLFQRLAHVVLELPPLRARRDDIPQLAEAALLRLDPARRWALSVSMRRLLLSPSLEWSGNVRQLERVIARARERALTRDPEATVLVPEHLDARDLDGVPPDAAASPLSSRASTPAPASGDAASQWQKLQTERARLDDMEKELVRATVDAARGVVAQAARQLGVARTTLSSRMDALGLRRRADG